MVRENTTIPVGLICIFSGLNLMSGRNRFLLAETQHWLRCVKTPVIATTKFKTASAV